MFKIERRNTVFISCHMRLSGSSYQFKEVPGGTYHFEKEKKFPVPPLLLKGFKA